MDVIKNNKDKRQKILDAANGCWWVEMYLMDRCGLTTSWKTVQDRKRERF